ncbi:MAG: hypothetical protein H6Q60_493 [Oscillospiraceae bacterium]|nr:hypothetical protein [Oscillospiraceae bacterium]
MEAEAKHRREYTTYGNVAYHAGYGGSVIQAPSREAIPIPQTRPKRRAAARPKVRVREAGEVSVFAVSGFLVLLGLALMLIFSYSQINEIHTGTVVLQDQLADLQKEEVSLMAREQMAYDLQAIEKQETGDGSMSKPRSSQQVILDDSNEDNAVLYQNESSTLITWIGQAVKNIGSLFSNVLSYFY